MQQTLALFTVMKRSAPVQVRATSCPEKKSDRRTRTTKNNVHNTLTQRQHSYCTCSASAGTPAVTPNDLIHCHHSQMRCSTYQPVTQMQLIRNIRPKGCCQAPYSTAHPNAATCAAKGKQHSTEDPQPGTAACATTCLPSRQTTSNSVQTHLLALCTQCNSPPLKQALHQTALCQLLRCVCRHSRTHCCIAASMARMPAVCSLQLTGADTPTTHCRAQHSAIRQNNQRE